MTTANNLSWRRSSFSGDGGTGGGNCVEAAMLADDRFALRDSKNLGMGALVFPCAGLTHLLDTLKVDR